MGNFLQFLGKMLNSPSRELFTVRLGVTVLLLKFGITGALATFLGFWLRGVLGLLIDSAIFSIDILLDTLREGMKLEEFEKVAEEQYKRATAKVYDEKQKQAIRQEYLTSIRKITFVGRPK